MNFHWALYGDLLKSIILTAFCIKKCPKKRLKTLSFLACHKFKLIVDLTGFLISESMRKKL